MSDIEEDESYASPIQHFPKPPQAHVPPPPTPLQAIDNSRPFILLLDNYDSFTYNLYQYLSQLGAAVQVLRNDELTADDFAKLNVSHLVISPGPGHPRTDSGVSRDAIRYFAGKVPILGVCMGLQCLVDAFGGEVAYAGEIVHGKASPIRHDGLGIFKGIPQNVLATRYHSLAANLPSFPPELAITATTTDSGVVMGVRHRVYTVEAVQYHPESILSHDGHAILRNFISYTGGTWQQNPQTGISAQGASTFDPSPESAAQKSLPSILTKIQQQRLLDVEQAKRTPGTTPQDLSTLYALHLAPPLIPVVQRMRAAQVKPSVMAEIKRASPSKGPIAVSTSAPAHALAYALAGAAVISVLTEPKWFLGSLQDMRLVREAVSHLPDRPAILRKDFILDEYQILEARLHGADTILLIVAMLSQERLASLYAYSRSLGMEPLVEVNNATEMERALLLPAKLIGVNNRNLHDFNVDMGTTSRLAEMTAAHPDIILCALSGITARPDVELYLSQGVGAVLVGEALMRASDPKAFIRSLLGLPPTEVLEEALFPKPLVKICGVRTPEEALLAAHAGADLLGLNFVPKSKRYIDVATGAVIARTVMPLKMSPSPAPLEGSGNEDVNVSATAPPSTAATTWFQHTTSHLGSLPRPLLVGLFQDASLETIMHTLAHVPLDLVQLHGSEPAQLASFIPVPVIKAYHVGPLGEGTEHVGRPGLESVILLDAAQGGGAGEPFDWEIAREVVRRGEMGREGRPLPIMLAGGLTIGNVREAVRRVKPWAVDVASGVEIEGRKDADTMSEFVRRAKGAWEEEPVVLETASEEAAATAEASKATIAVDGESVVVSGTHPSALTAHTDLKPTNGTEKNGVDIGLEVIGNLGTGTVTAAPPQPTPSATPGVQTPVAPAPALGIKTSISPSPRVSSPGGTVPPVPVRRRTPGTEEIRRRVE